MTYVTLTATSSYRMLETPPAQAASLTVTRGNHVSPLERLDSIPNGRQAQALIDTTRARRFVT